ncbi:hypothetical protein EST38_g9188 [Candolleomyces aberdarensis]|uniref:CxC1-like cysteine cluster associated with KDZ transposases domain-containing protein n=1 Tax=Candolleomyces aberdarensis TaxID=2316362 RepID=A0A4Q2DDH5_9AGAR|nr:hypothetical protein EST38_g9188 [Candolleomyces aberdarensis]
MDKPTQPSKLSYRRNQRAQRGLGNHFATPKRNRTQERKQITASSYARKSKLQLLDARIASLYQSRGKEKQSEDQDSGAESDTPAYPAGDQSNGPPEDWTGMGMEVEQPVNSGTVGQDDHGADDWVDDTEVSAKPAKRVAPDEEAEELYRRWKVAILMLVEPLLKYLNSTMGKEWRIPPAVLATDCGKGDCPRTKHQVTGLLFASFLTYKVTACACQPLTYVLVRNGMFPTAPLSPRWAVSIELLDLFLALTERSSDAVTALAAALNSTYKRRSFVLLTSKGKRVHEPFRRGLGYAMQWYDCLRIEIERMKEKAIASKFSSPAQGTSLGCNLTANGISSPPPVPTTIVPGAVVPGPGEQFTVFEERVPFGPIPPPALLECHRLLQGRCPACFGGNKFGTAFVEGGDIHVATDCNFNHRHIRGVANSPAFYDPEFFLSKEEVDHVGNRIEAARPQTNVDTPGEQQKYAVALIERLVSLIPRNATMVVLYDVGCVLDRSITKYEIFSIQIAERLLMATSVMHSYVHQWSCQLHYNPRLKTGLGLTDGENVERLWSRIRGLIGANRRTLLLDRQLQMIAHELRGDLGTWSRRKMKNGVQSQRAEAKKALKDCGEEVPVLREQWENQKQSQMSVQAHAPNRLKKDLDKILEIQTEIQDLENTIQKSSSLVKSGVLPAACRSSIQDLQRLCTDIQAKAQQMYTALNVSHEFPTIQGIELEFIRKIFLLRELKFQVQRRATSAFWEFDKLDRAAGGKDVPHGTKMHQTIRATMSKKTAALTNAVEHYNRDCEKLAKMRPQNCAIPLPKPLPTNLKQLKACPDLMESVWLEPVDSEKQRWVYDADIRDGIRAVHRIDRCAEEARRLGREADNMCRWFGRELSAVAEAIKDPSNVDLLCFLQQDFDDVLALADTWPTPLAPRARYDEHVKAASRDGTLANGLTWLTLTETENDDVDEVATTDGELDPDQLRVDDLLIEEYAEEQSETAAAADAPIANLACPGSEYLA